MFTTSVLETWTTSGYREAINYVLTEMDPHLVHGYMPNGWFSSPTRTAVVRISIRDLDQTFAENIIMTVGAGSSINVIMKTSLTQVISGVVFAPYFVGMQTGLATTMQRQ